MFRVWTKNLGRVGTSEAHLHFLALTCSDVEQLGKPFLLKGNFIPIISQWGLSVAMETRVLIQSSPKPYAAFPPPQ